MSRTCDILFLNMFDVEHLCRMYKVGCGWDFFCFFRVVGRGVGGVYTKRCVRWFGFWRETGWKKSDKLGRAVVCKWVGEWDRGWWRKRRWEAGLLGGGGE